MLLRRVFLHHHHHRRHHQNTWAWWLVCTTTPHTNKPANQLPAANSETCIHHSSLTTCMYVCAHHRCRHVRHGSPAQPGALKKGSFVAISNLNHCQTMGQAHTCTQPITTVPSHATPATTAAPTATSMGVTFCRLCRSCHFSSFL